TFWDYALTLSRFGLLSAAPDRQVPERLIGLISRICANRNRAKLRIFEEFHHITRSHGVRIRYKGGLEQVTFWRRTWESNTPAKYKRRLGKPQKKGCISSPSASSVLALSPCVSP